MLKEFKRLVALLLVVLITCNILNYSIIAAENNDDVLKLVELGILNGTNNGFELERAPTRVEGLVMVLRLIGKEDEAFSYEGKSIPFRDVPEWALPYVSYAYNEGLTKGISENEFGSLQVIKAESYMTLVLRALEYSDTKGDFEWKNAIEKGLEVGILDNTDVSLMEDFSRASMVIITSGALTTKMKYRRVALEEYRKGSNSVDEISYNSGAVKPDVTEDSGVGLVIVEDKNVEKEIVEKEIVEKEIAEEEIAEGIYFSVKDAGAKADAYLSSENVKGTDATKAFQEAVDNNSTILIPKGNYRIDGTVVINNKVTIYAEPGAVIYSNAVQNTKTPIFNVKKNGSGSIFRGMDVRSFDKYLVYMPNDKPTAKSSNRMFINGDGAVNILVEDCTTKSLMYSVHGFGMDYLEVKNCSFQENYIVMWFGDAKNVNIHDTFLSTSESADIYAHCIYVGFDTYNVNISNITVQQKGKATGAILNFAWVSGDKNKYYIHDVNVDGVTILPSYTVNHVVQLYGVENATFRNIKGTILENKSSDGGSSMVKVSNSNGEIVFKECEIVFDYLSTLVKSTSSNIKYTMSITFDQCNYTINKLESHFLRPYVKTVTMSNSTINFGKNTLSKYTGFYEAGVDLNFKNSTINFFDYFNLCASINPVEGYDVDVLIEGCTFKGEKANTSLYLLNGINEHTFTFKNNTLINCFPGGNVPNSIESFIKDKHLDSFESYYSGNVIK